jgi:hypothetical protein
MSQTLFVIEHALSDLLETRTELEEQVAFTDEQIAEKQAALDAVDKAIVEYVTAEVRKVDNIARLLIELKARREAILDEQERLGAIAARMIRQEDRVKALVLQVMQDCDVRKLEGKIGTLRRVGNGGVQPVEVTQPELLPADVQRITVTLPLQAWRGILRGMSTGLLIELEKVVKEGKPEPDLTAIRQQLERGEGVPGAVLLPRGEHLRVS